MGRGGNSSGGGISYTRVGSCAMCCVPVTVAAFQNNTCTSAARGDQVGNEFKRTPCIPFGIQEKESDR